MSATAQPDALSRTPLHALHCRAGAKMAPFAGYQMPMRYRGIVAEHRHTRAAAGLFDVSHMGQLEVRGAGVATALERLLPLDMDALDIDGQSYALMTHAAGGVVDDMMVTRWGAERFFLIVNASRKRADFAHLRAGLPANVSLSWLPDRALLALQGPAARSALEALAPGAGALRFLHGAALRVAGVACYVTRSGYTGEDGFEISCPASRAEALAESLLASPDVALAGLGARDTLRLEAGLCLYGNELDEDTTPAQAGLSWSIARSRRPGGDKAGGFPGAERILPELSAGATRRRCGLVADSGAPARAGDALFADDGLTERVGTVTSGSFSPTLGRPIAMACAESAWIVPDRVLHAAVRDRARPMRVTALPFVPARHWRG